MRRGRRWKDYDRAGYGGYEGDLLGNVLQKECLQEAVLPGLYRVVKEFGDKVSDQSKSFIHSLSDWGLVVSDGACDVNQQEQKMPW
mmetsp:Transcript_14460/g.34864  ORF Transcript_14460/g.34864 Transcript_14460/m.34864 type:complete len:86 (-) Transcript_14460:83-340(-)